MRKQLRRLAICHNLFIGLIKIKIISFCHVYHMWERPFSIFHNLDLIALSIRLKGEVVNAQHLEVKTLFLSTDYTLHVGQIINSLSSVFDGKVLQKINFQLKTHAKVSLSNIYASSSY